MKIERATREAREVSVRVCSRCRGKYAGDGPLCPECAPTRKEQARHVKRAEPFYGTALWQRTRQQQLNRYPLCQSCSKRGLVTPATTVDHIIELSDGGHRTDPANLQSICRTCHARKTAVERKKRERGF